MAEWLIEEGIGEHRAIRIDGDAIVGARLAWPGELAAGAVIEAKLVSRHAGSKRGTAETAEGTQLLVDRLPRETSEGATIRLEVTRAAIGEGARLKRAQARPSDSPLRPAPPLAEQLAADGYEAKIIRRFPISGWEELCAEAFEGRVAFAGGELHLAPTPAMTLIDIDGDLPPRALALAAVPAIAAALHRFDIGGSVGIDFPTLSDKADRRAVDEALASALDGYRHERTAMNGFGFVQVVSRLTGPSILQRLTRQRMAAAARLLLRRAELVDDPGAILLTCHPALKAKLKPEWLEALARRTGREVRTETEPGLAPESGFAQSVPL